MRRALLLIAPALFACPAESPEAQRSVSAGAQEEPETSSEAESEGESPLAEKVAQFAPAKLSADISSLPESEKKALRELIEASRLLDPVFDRQAWARNPELAAELEGAEGGEAKLA